MRKSKKASNDTEPTDKDIISILSKYEDIFKVKLKFYDRYHIKYLRMFVLLPYFYENKYLNYLDELQRLEDKYKEVEKL